VLTNLYPNRYCESIFDINLNELKKMGINSLIIDLDNTILARDTREAPEELREWLKKITAEGFKACILSNNWRARVSSVASQLNLPLVARAGKPRRKAFRQALEILKATPAETAVIGDQIFTDVFGGNRNGLYTILVVPLSEKEALHTKLLRRVERRILNRFKQTKT
jgi:hypothetical protein